MLVKTSSGIADVPQLAGKKVLTVKGGTQEPNIRKAVPDVDVVTFETTQQAFLALQQGKGVGYVNDEASLVNDFAKLGPAKKDYAHPAHQHQHRAAGAGHAQGRARRSRRSSTTRCATSRPPATPTSCS